MKALVLVLSAAFCALADPMVDEHVALWSEGTALTTPKGRIEAGLASPWSWGLGNIREISSYVLYDALVPGLRFKQQWQAWSSVFIASTHSVYSLTPLLLLLRREGTGGIIPPDNDIPVFIGTDSYVIATWRYSGVQYASVRLGARLNFGIGENTLESIDYFMAYPRTASCISGYSMSAGIDLRGKVWKPVYYAVNSDLFLMPGMNGAWEYEQSGSLIWRYKNRLAVSAGARYVAGEFPFGFDWMIFPLFDVRMGFGAGR
jgi:hypothetical protein